MAEEDVKEQDSRSNHPRNIDQGPARYVPLQVQAGPASKFVPPEEIPQGQAHIIVIGPTNIPPEKSSKEPSGNDQDPARDALEDDLGIVKPYPSGDIPPTNYNNNAQGQEHPTNVPIEGQGLDESTRNSQSQKQKEE
ncbi:hypothetical protein HAX54_025041 [Datura stramonium]|uniref:Uncharacterized protein n=1 Tax=Datura stramonium TaxID=4076 RepID=A0ABS8V1E0_DATST|nr:hypothetical protein [Datura stramonium]